MLAYLFWHSPADAVERSEYEALLAAFHERLREAPPPGFRESVAFAVTTAWAGTGYEDWYLVDGWRALGVLNADAVDDVRGPEHEPVARRAATGAGGVYALRAGDMAVGDAGAAEWSVKPAGEPYPDWEARLTAGRDAADFALWQRQLVLGPAPEYCLLTPGDSLRRIA